MPTMSHNDEHRKLWHLGKKRVGESKYGWLNRVIARIKPNHRAAFTPPQLKKSGLHGQPIPTER